MYIPTQIKRELVKFCVNCDQKGQVVKTFHKGSMAMLVENISSLSDIESIMLGGGEEIYEIVVKSKWNGFG